MIKLSIKKLFIFLLVLISLFLFACARGGAPDGGNVEPAADGGGDVPYAEEVLLPALDLSACDLLSAEQIKSTCHLTYSFIAENFGPLDSPGEACLIRPAPGTSSVMGIGALQIGHKVIRGTAQSHGRTLLALYADDERYPPAEISNLGDFAVKYSPISQALNMPINVAVLKNIPGGEFHEEVEIQLGLSREWNDGSVPVPDGEGCNEEETIALARIAVSQAH